jgi:putative transposase
MVYHAVFKTRAQARLAAFKYLEVWYNRARKHSALIYLIPCQYENFFLPKAVAAWKKASRKRLQFHWLL